jgi:hypothetical protein
MSKKCTLCGSTDVSPYKGISDGVCHYFGDDENFEIIGSVHEMEVEK